MGSHLRPVAVAPHRAPATVVRTGLVVEDDLAVGCGALAEAHALSLGEQECGLAREFLEASGEQHTEVGGYVDRLTRGIVTHRPGADEVESERPRVEPPPVSVGEEPLPDRTGCCRVLHVTSSIRLHADWSDSHRMPTGNSGARPISPPFDSAM